MEKDRTLRGRTPQTERKLPQKHQKHHEENQASPAYAAVLALLEGAGAEVAGVMAITKAAALAYLMFNLFTPPCFAALGAMNSEIGSRKWFWGGVGLQLGTGFTLSFLVYQVGTLITTGSFGAGFLPGLLAVAVMAAVIVWLCRSADRKAAVKATV